MNAEAWTWIGRVWAATFLAIGLLFFADQMVVKLCTRAERRRDVARVHELAEQFTRDGVR